MSSIDQSRAYLSLREQITQIRNEFGEATAWRIVEQAVIANMHSEKYVIHTVSNAQAIQALRNKKAGETA